MCSTRDGTVNKSQVRCIYVTGVPTDEWVHTIIITANYGLMLATTLHLNVFEGDLSCARVRERCGRCAYVRARCDGVKCWCSADSFVALPADNWPPLWVHDVPANRHITNNFLHCSPIWPFICNEVIVRLDFFPCNQHVVVLHRGKCLPFPNDICVHS